MAADALVPSIAKSSTVMLTKINRSLLSKKKDFKYLCHISIEKWHKIQIYFYVSTKLFSIYSYAKQFSGNIKNIFES